MCRADVKIQQFLHYNLERILYRCKACLTFLSKSFRFRKALGSMEVESVGSDSEGSIEAAPLGERSLRAGSLEDSFGKSLGSFSAVNFFFDFLCPFFTAVAVSIILKFDRKSASEMIYETIDLKIICLNRENISV